MDIWEASKLALFIWFVVPGFLSIKFYQLMFPGVYKSSTELLVDAVSYSCMNYALLSWAILYVEKSSLLSVHPSMYYGFYFFAFFVSPLIIVWLWKKIRTSQWSQNMMPHPTERPWDFVFSQGKSYWVHVHLTDGGLLSGLFHTDSFASSTPAPEQIYIEQLWKIGEGREFLEPISGTAGVLVSASQIKYIEFKDFKG